MLVLHAIWLPASDAQPAHLALWGESGAAQTAAGRRGPARHPFSAPPQALSAALGLTAAEESVLTLRLPTIGKWPQPSRAFLLSDTPTGKVKLKAWTVPAVRLTAADSLSALINLPGPDDDTPGLELGADARFWQAAARWALELLAGQKFKPTLEPLDGERCLARWEPTLDAAEDQARLDQLARAMPPAARAAADDTIAPRAMVLGFVNTVVDAFCRANAALAPRRKRLRPSPGERWLQALSAENPELNLPPAFIEQYQAWSQPAEAGAGNFRLCFRLDPPETKFTDDIVVPKARAEDWLVRYFLQAHDDASLLVPAEAVWRSRGSALTFLNRKFDAPQEKLLAGLGLAARIFTPIENSLRQARPEGCALDAQGAYDFIREAALLLQSSGFGVLLPGLSTKLGVRVKLRPATPKKAPKGGVASLTLERAVQFDWELALGDQPLTHAEFEKLAELKVPLVQIRGQWVEVRPEQLQQALDFLEQRQTAGELDLDEALRLALAPEPAAGLPIVQVETEGWLGEMLAQMADQAKLKPLPAPPAFVGTLRHYQVTRVLLAGVPAAVWPGRLPGRRHGPGQDAADHRLSPPERGQRAGNGHKPALVVCPTSVVSNWAHEVARFAPGLRVLVHQGAAREKDGFARQAAEHDLVVTSYALLHRDEARLKDVAWEPSSWTRPRTSRTPRPSRPKPRAIYRPSTGWR